MNPIDENLKTGTLGELLVQLRFLQYGVQAAPPLKDSGNDLIAIRGNVMRAIQVKTTTTERFDCRGLPEMYHVLALVQLVGEDRDIHLDLCHVFLLPKADIAKGSYSVEELTEWELAPQLIDKLFAE